MEMLADRRALGVWTEAVRRRGETLGFVPTMGALHEGHLSLVRAARARTDRVVVSIFVNPVQFGPGEDFDRYPRTLDRDRELLMQAGCSALFHPPKEEVFGRDGQTMVRVDPLGQDLCGRFRPHHFQGVATVVAILFNLVRPTQAFFGWKDYQQVVVIQRMVDDLAMPVRVVGLPILREADGLAMSSRNRYLAPEERKKAAGLYQALQAARQMWQKGGGKSGGVGGEPEAVPSAEALEACARKVLAAFDVQDIDYVEVRDARTLDAWSPQEGRVQHADPVLLIAARLGATRLIDNRVLSAEVEAGSEDPATLSFVERGR